jgi:hypothetical protein
MFKRQWVVTIEYRDPYGHHPTWTQVIDGPFRFKWLAEAHASAHRAQEAQYARTEGEAMRKIDVEQQVHAGSYGIGLP